ncbi:MAG: hypothetical protein EAZ30_00365 [Betaproteobacteria bacterium]|nr:MAG: hypothetical protein EAZ43_12605 [Betaproteobacteria bacterium]TAG50196.1 MAG: hypothetical protein EAZ30_00365 [Betaproteobacteria bacterium]
MGKVIFWIVVFFLVLLALRMVSVYKSRQEAKDDEAQAKKSKRADRDDAKATDSMVKCSQCGTYIAQSSAQRKATGWACADAACARRS